MRLDYPNDLSRTKEALAKKNDKRSIAKLLDVSPNTLYGWLKVRRPSVDLTKQLELNDVAA
jgi:transposase-like protein